MSKRIAKEVTKKEDLDLLLSITEDTITASFLMNLFGEFDGVQKHKPYDYFKVPKGSYTPEGTSNTNEFTTTVGLWIFNKYCIEKELFGLFGYINNTLASKQFKGMHNKLSYALIEDKITTATVKRFIMKTQHLMPFVSVLSPSMTEKMLTSTTEINKKKKELLTKYKAEIEAGDEVTVNVMEQELIDFATEYLEGDPSMDSYLSGARGSIGNNFKNMFISKGAMKDPNPTKGFNISTGNYMDGISAAEYPMLANSLAEGPFSRGKKTEIGGYSEKLYVAAFQAVILDKPGSDCKTNRYLDIVLDNPGDWIYSYIIEGSQLVELTSDNIDKYKGKKVKVRFSGLCESKTGTCNKCMGNQPYRMGIENVGLYLSVVQSKVKNAAMKSFHDSSLKLTEMDINKVFGY